MIGVLPSRRAFLGGAGALLTLPFLPSLLPRAARAEAAAPVRLLWFFMPNGIVPSRWGRVVADGADSAGWAPSDPDATLWPLADVAGEVSVITGLQNLACVSEHAVPHTQGTAGALTCAPVQTPEVWVGVSADQVAARQTRDLTVLPSLQVSGEPVGRLACDAYFACDYVLAVSWEDYDRPLFPVTDPRVLFEQLVAGADPDATAEERARRQARKSSVLDRVLGDARRAHDRAGSEDRLRLQAYLDGVRELERRVSVFDAQATCAGLVEPPEVVGDTARADLISDLIVQALQCDRTRVVSYMLGHGLSSRDMGFLGIAGEHHSVTHHLQIPERVEDAARISQWQVERYAHLVRRLRDTPEGEGTLLDQCAVALVSDVSDGNEHNQDDLPVLLAGRAGGAFTPGRRVEAGGAPLASLHLAMLHTIDPTVPEFSVASEPLSGLG